MFTPQSLLSLPDKCSGYLPFWKWKGMPVERPGAYTWIFGFQGYASWFFRKLVIVVTYKKVCIFLREGSRVTSESPHSKTFSSCWEGKLWLFIIQRPVCSYRLHSQAPPPSGFGHFWEGIEFSEKLNVSYSIVRLWYVQ